MKKKPKYDEVLIAGDDEALMEYAYDTDKCVVVDWREDDEDIVEYVADFVKGELSAEMTEDEPPKMVVTYKGEESVIELTESAADRYVVLRGLNAVLEGEYELRVFKVTLESDTHAFLVKPVVWWQAMEERFGDRIEEVFSPLTELIDFS